MPDPMPPCLRARKTTRLLNGNGLRRGLIAFYVDFTSKVADGRKIPKRKVLDIAKEESGPGSDAKNLRPCRRIRRLRRSTQILAKKSANIADNEEVKVVVFPKENPYGRASFNARAPTAATRNPRARDGGNAQGCAAGGQAARCTGGDTKSQGSRRDVLMMPVLEAGR